MKKFWVAGLLLSGCVYRSDAVRARAAYDLDCPAPEVEVYEAAAGLMVAKGCGKWTQYTCHYEHSNFICRTEPPAIVSPDTTPEPPAVVSPDTKPSPAEDPS